MDSAGRAGVLVCEGSQTINRCRKLVLSTFSWLCMGAGFTGPRMGSNRFWQGWLTTTVALYWWWHVMTIDYGSLHQQVASIYLSQNFDCAEALLGKCFVEERHFYRFFFVSDESSTAVGPFSAAEMWPQFMLPRQHSGGPAPDNRNGGENHVLNPEPSSFLFNMFNVFLERPHPRPSDQRLVQPWTPWTLKRPSSPSLSRMRRCMGVRVQMLLVVCLNQIFYETKMFLSWFHNPEVGGNHWFNGMVVFSGDVHLRFQRARDPLISGKWSVTATAGHMPERYFRCNNQLMSCPFPVPIWGRLAFNVFPCHTSPFLEPCGHVARNLITFHLTRVQS